MSNNDYIFGGPSANPTPLRKTTTQPLAALDMPGEAGDVEAMKEYIAGKNSTQAERDRLHAGSGLVEKNYDPGVEQGELGHLSKEQYKPSHKLSRHGSDE